MKNKIASVYWIHLAEHTNPLLEGYIGVSQNVGERINQHFDEINKKVHKNKHLIYAVEKYKQQNLLVDILFTDNEDVCYLKESEFRPTKDIGWNISPGGHKGPGRPKGQPLSKTAIEKAKETRQQRKERILSGNLTDDDILFLDRQKERQLKTQKKHLAKQQEKIKNKIEKQQKKLALKEKIKKEKLLKRIQGVTHTEQPNRPLCNNCKISLAKPNGISKHGFKKWHKYCASCAKAAYDNKSGFLLEKKNYCESCNFKATDKCQLDIIYKDNNKKNKNKNNLKTLCANCSRLYRKKYKEKQKSILDITIDSDVRI